jgi:hypothetical protein
MKQILGSILIAIILMMATVTAESYSQGQLALTANEALKLGQVMGMMDAGKLLIKDTPAGWDTYNEMVPQVNDLISQHNELMMYIFAGNATALSKLLIEPYDYL